LRLTPRTGSRAFFVCACTFYPQVLGDLPFRHPLHSSVYCAGFPPPFCFSITLGFRGLRFLCYALRFSNSRFPPAPSPLSFFAAFSASPFLFPNLLCPPSKGLAALRFLTKTTDFSRYLTNHFLRAPLVTPFSAPPPPHDAACPNRPRDPPRTCHFPKPFFCHSKFSCSFFASYHSAVPHFPPMRLRVSFPSPYVMKPRIYISVKSRPTPTTNIGNSRLGPPHPPANFSPTESQYSLIIRGISFPAPALS